MRKRQALTVETTRAKPLSTLITAPKTKVDQDKYQSTAPSTGSSTPVSSISPIEVGTSEPPNVDDIGSGQTLYERLTLASGEYCPTLSPAFYRRVWFDGLEAFEPYHFVVDLANGCVVPNASLPAGTVVTASYVKT